MLLSPRVSRTGFNFSSPCCSSTLGQLTWIGHMAFYGLNQCLPVCLPREKAWQCVAAEEVLWKTSRMNSTRTQGRQRPCVEDPRVDIHPCWAMGSPVRTGREPHWRRALKRICSLKAHRSNVLSTLTTPCPLGLVTISHLSTPEDLSGCPNASWPCPGPHMGVLPHCSSFLVNVSSSEEKNTCSVP